MADVKLITVIVHLSEPKARHVRSQTRKMRIG